MTMNVEFFSVKENTKTVVLKVSNFVSNLREILQEITEAH